MNGVLILSLKNGGKLEFSQSFIVNFGVGKKGVDPMELSTSLFTLYQLSKDESYNSSPPSGLDFIKMKDTTVCFEDGCKINGTIGSTTLLVTFWDSSFEISTIDDVSQQIFQYFHSIRIFNQTSQSPQLPARKVVLSGLKTFLKSLPRDLLRENIASQPQSDHVCNFKEGTNISCNSSICADCEQWMTDQWNLAQGITVTTINTTTTSATLNTPIPLNITSSSCSDLNASSTPSDDTAKSTLTSQSARSASLLPPINNNQKKVVITGSVNGQGDVNNNHKGMSRLFGRYFTFGSKVNKNEVVVAGE